jgi:hypothetical protein
VDPFFLDDLDQIKSLLRLKEVSVGGPSEDLLIHAVGQARTVFWTPGIRRAARHCSSVIRRTLEMRVAESIASVPSP